MSPRRLLMLALMAWIVVVGVGLVLGAPLTSDESAYALLARGTAASWLYRPRGVVALAQLGVALGGSELAMRLGPALLSLGFVVAIAALGRRAYGPWVGAWSAAVAVGSHAFVLRAPELLGDVPAAACLLAAVTIVIGELGRPHSPRYRLIAVAPALAAAFYLRYGSAPMLVVIGVAALVAYGRGVRARPGPVIATAVVLGALLAPFAVASLRATGSVFGILVISREVASHLALGHGLRVFVLCNSFARYGALVPLVMVAGLIGIVWPAPAPGRARTTRFLGALALGQLVAIGMVSHASTRYVFFAVALLIVIGVDTIARAVDRHCAPPSGGAERSGNAGPLVARPRLVALAGVAVASAWLALAAIQPRLQHHMRAGLADLVRDADAIRADAASAGAPCVIAAYAVPQLMWYSGCAAIKLPGPLAIEPGQRLYAASTPDWPVDANALGLHATPLPGAPSAWLLTTISPSSAAAR